MQGLQVYLLGGVRVLAGEPPLDIKLSGIPRALLTYLVITRPQVHTRDSLAALFWSDQGEHSARNCLNTVLWRLRKALEPAGTPRGTYLVTTTSGEVGFNPDSQFWLDVAEFEERAMRVIQRPVEAASLEDARGLEQVLSLFHGDPLEGCYEDWALRERERLRSLQFKALEWLMLFFSFRQDFEQGLEYGNRVLEVDPLREEVVRAVMQLYHSNGQRTEALRLFKGYKEMLRSELGIDPMIETQTVYAGILTASGPNAVAAQTALDQGMAAQLRLQVQGALVTLDSLRGELERIMQSLDALDGSSHAN